MSYPESAGGVQNIVAGTGINSTGGSTPTISLASPLPATSANPLKTQGGSTLDDGSGNVVLAGYLLAAPVATTGTNGYAEINGTGTIISWTAPNDGKLHATVATVSYTSSASITGGAIGLQIFSSPTGTGLAALYYSPSAGATNAPLVSQIIMLQPGQQLRVVQNGALTAGTVTVWASIYSLG